MWKYLNSSELVFKVQTFFGIEKNERTKMIDKNKFFHCLFLLGTELGDELFYGIFIPIFFFNFDSHIGRRFVFHWFVNMYVGQALKEIFREERPKPPAIQLQRKWSNEYSLPSTHAMGSLSITASIFYFALNRYEFNHTLGIIFIVLWVTVISLSRVYLGMHSVLDLLVGVAISVVLLVILLPVTNIIETFLATSAVSPVFILIVPMVSIVYFPTTQVWTPTRGDTCIIAAVFTGIELGAWFNYNFGLLNLTEVPFPLKIDLSDLYNLGLRTAMGLLLVRLTEKGGNYYCYSLICMLSNEDKRFMEASENSTLNYKKNVVELTTKFITYSAIGFNTMVLVPQVFKYFDIQRNSFFQEL